MSDLEQQTMWVEDGVHSSAILSKDGRYRYQLTRVWRPQAKLVNWIMLNPSTADAREDDPTIRRCVAFAKEWGYGGIVVSNLFGLRSPDPTILKSDTDPVGPDNDQAIVDAACAASLHVAAWGAFGAFYTRHLQVRKLLTAYPLRLSLKCLGHTNSKHPRHPLYVKGDTALIPLETA